MLKGYAGRILNIDLDKEQFIIQDLDEALVRKYIGGSGLAAKIVWDETGRDTGALSEENPLIFMVGPLTGTAVPSSSRYIVAAISPLTNIWGQAHSGGTWAAELKHAGFDGIIFRRKAKKPVYLWVNDGQVQLRDATHLWGKDTYEASELIMKETDSRASVAVIGRAGERLVKFANIMNDGKAGRAAARCGMGAVMGSKNVKAVAVKGTAKPRVSNETKLKESITRYFATTVIDEKTRRDKGMALWQSVWQQGRGAIKNFLEGDFDSFGDKFVELMVGGSPYFCRGCRTSCIESRLEEGTRHPVWEAVVPLGSLCLIDNFKAIGEAYDLCNRYGLDSISTGVTIAFAMEAYEKGLITKGDCDGIELRWGNHEALVQMVQRIGEKQGFGEVLGWGSREAAKHIGGIAIEYAMQAKGLELPAYDPRFSNAIAIEYATSNVGPWHLSAGGTRISPQYSQPDLGITPLERFATEGIATAVARMQHMICLMDSLGCCKFNFLPDPNYLPREQAVKPHQFVELLNLITGWDMDLEEFVKCGQRIFNLQRMINVRRGISRKDDTLPPRLLTHKRGGRSECANNLPPLGAMLNEYYSYRGWSEEGIPTEGKLKELGL